MDPVVPPGQEVTVIALVAIAVTTLVGLVDRLGKVLIRWVAQRLKVPEDDSAARLDRIEDELRKLRGGSDE